jgi:hypothetical protein
MANKKITDLPSLTGANATSSDLLPIVDVSADLTSSITRGEFFSNLPAMSTTSLFSASNVAITGGSITGITALAPAVGGTGVSSYAIGDILYASGTTTLAKLADVATGNVLLSGGVGVAPSYGKVALATCVSGQLPVVYGGTGAATLTGYVKANGTSVMTASNTIPNTDISGLGTMSTQAASAVAITGGTINGPTINNSTIGATTASTARFTSVVLSNSLYTYQPTETPKSAAAILTIAELLTGIIRYTGAVANLTLPLGTAIETGVIASLPVNGAFNFSVINTGTGIATLVTATGLTLIGSMAVTNGTSGSFRVRKTAANTYTVYRV